MSKLRSRIARCVTIAWILPVVLVFTVGLAALLAALQDAAFSRVLAGVASLVLVAWLSDLVVLLVLVGHAASGDDDPPNGGDD
mgnify:CR=1 FL=1